MGGRGSSTNKLQAKVTERENDLLKALESVEKSVFDEGKGLSDGNIRDIYKTIRATSVFSDELNKARTVEEVNKIPSGLTLKASQKYRTRYEGLIAHDMLNNRDKTKYRRLKKEADRFIDELEKQYRAGK